MIDNNNWEYVYKLTDGYPCSTNVLYTPTISPDKDKLCMHYWTESPKYMATSCVPRTDELMEYWFNQEVYYLMLFQGKSWCPELYEIDKTNRKILIEFNKESLNWPMYTEGRSIEEYSENWKEELFFIIKDIFDMGYYKNALYPHCFFYTKTGQLKTIDYYSVIDIKNPMIHKDVVTPIIGVDSQHRYEKVKKGDYYDASMFFENTLKNWVQWPGNPAPEFYARLFNEN